MAIRKFRTFRETELIQGRSVIWHMRFEINIFVYGFASHISYRTSHIPL
jgi:hypothetical protein